MVTTQGFNALLKIVEEPPEHLVFVFATTEPDKVLTTIRSRTHHYPFRLIPPGTLRGCWSASAPRRTSRSRRAVYPLVIRAGGGSARDSLSVLDQLLAGAGPEGVTYERAVALLGRHRRRADRRRGRRAGRRRRAAVFGAVDRLVEAGHDPRRFAADLLQRLRDLIAPAGRAGGRRARADRRPRRRAGPDGRRRRRGSAPATLTRYAEILHAGLTEMRGATAPRLLLELLCARMLLPAASDTDSAVLQRLERLEQGMVAARPVAAPARGTAPERDTPADAVVPPQPAGAPGDAATRFQRPSQRQATPPSQPDTTVPAAPPAPSEPDPVSPPVPDRQPAQASPPAPAEDAVRAGDSPATTPEPDAVPEPRRTPEPEPAAAQTLPQEVSEVPAAAGPDAAAIRAVWSEVRAKVRDRSRTVEVMLSGATVREVDGNRVVLVHDSAPLVKRLAEPRNATVIAAALGDVFGGHVRSHVPARVCPGRPGQNHSRTSTVEAVRTAAFFPSEPSEADTCPVPGAVRTVGASAECLRDPARRRHPAAGSARPARRPRTRAWLRAAPAPGPVCGDPRGRRADVRRGRHPGRSLGAARPRRCRDRTARGHAGSEATRREVAAGQIPSLVSSPTACCTSLRSLVSFGR